MLKLYFFLLGYFTNLFMCNKIIILISKGKHIKKNYLGTKIPNSMGLSISITQLIITPVLLYSLKDYKMLIILLVGSIISLMGIIDDFFGDSSKGFKGHILEFSKGNITTGFLKIILGSIAAFLTSYIFHTNILELFLNTLIIVLSINTLNLFDVRPGRALKIYYILVIPLILLITFNEYEILPIIILGASLAYFPMDIKGKAMLGDIGSNLLGYYLGLCFIISNINEVSIIIILLIINIISEKISLSSIISKNRLLNYLDCLGRDR